MIRYRIKQYPEDTFVVQYKPGFLLWFSIQEIWQGHTVGPKVFRSLAQANEEIVKQKAHDTRLAFKTVYHEPN